MGNSLLLFLFLFLGGCATKQVAMPVKAPQETIMKDIAPLPAAVVPQTAKMESQPVQAPSSKDNLSQEFIKGKGQEVEVVTNPPGARIEMNGKFLGTAPGKFFVIREPNRYGFLPRMTITAIPSNESRGEYVQSKLFDGYTSTPEKIYFDMSRPSPLPGLEGE
jgi:hypothetical protein